MFIMWHKVHSLLADYSSFKPFWSLTTEKSDSNIEVNYTFNVKLVLVAKAWFKKLW